LCGFTRVLAGISTSSTAKLPPESALTVRVCLRVTEPADGDLILGRGKAKQGYRPDLLDSPGKLLAWDPPDHTRPIPAKAYTLDRPRIRQLVTAPTSPSPT
jgi:hypothetical protein